MKKIQRSTVKHQAKLWESSWWEGGGIIWASGVKIIPGISTKIPDLSTCELAYSRQTAGETAWYWTNEWQFCSLFWLRGPWKCDQNLPLIYVLAFWIPFPMLGCFDTGVEVGGGAVLPFLNVQRFVDSSWEALPFKRSWWRLVCGGSGRVTVREGGNTAFGT